MSDRRGAGFPEVLDDGAPDPSLRVLSGPAHPRTPQPRTRDQLRAAYAGVTAVDVVLAGAVAETVDEVDHAGLVAAVALPLRDQIVPLTLPDGRRVASLTEHLRRWRTTPGGFVRLPFAGTRRR